MPCERNQQATVLVTCVQGRHCLSVVCFIEHSSHFRQIPTRVSCKDHVDIPFTHNVLYWACRLANCIHPRPHAAGLFPNATKRSLQPSRRAIALLTLQISTPDACGTCMNFQKSNASNNSVRNGYFASLCSTVHATQCCIPQVD